MKLRPGPALLATAGGAVGLALCCFIWNGAAWLVAALAIAGAILVALDYRQLHASWRHLAVRRQLPAVAGRDARFPVALCVQNAGPVPLDSEIRDVLPDDAVPSYWSAPVHLSAGEETRLSTELHIPQRGLHPFGPVWLRLRGKYGMLEGQRGFECRSEMKVLPAGARAGEALEKDVRAEIALLEKTSRTRLRGEGMEFESLSEYRTGDDPRRIDWRATARQGRVVMRRYQIEQHRDLLIVLDCGRLMGIAADHGTKLDRAVDAALMLSRIALEKGDRCGLGIFDDKVLGFLPPQAGPAAQRAILESLYNVQSRLREANFGAMFATLQARQVKRSLLVILSDIADAESSDTFRAALASLAKRHVVLFAALRTPLMNELLRTPVDTVLDVSRKAVVLRLLRAREAALHSLGHCGVHVLDVEPRQLTVPLVNRYIALRERNLL